MARERPLRVLEPACGEGIFLGEAFRSLCIPAGLGAPGQRTRDGRLTPGDPGSPRRETAKLRWALLRSSCFGVDIDQQATATARRHLAELVWGPDADGIDHRTEALRSNVRWGDALRDGESHAAERARHREARSPSAPPPIDFASAFPAPGGSPDAGNFDAMVGNPPYVNIRLLTRSVPRHVRDSYRDRYRTASGAYDLYVLFLERALELLRPGGVCGMIVPNKLATSDYARVCRSLLQQQTRLLQVLDLSTIRVFGEANVYPFVIIWQKLPPGPQHRVATACLRSLEELGPSPPRTQVAQRQFCADHGWSLEDAPDVESRVATRRLQDVATLYSGTTGFCAEQIASQLQEADGAASAGFSFIVSRNIDRYRIHRGHLRFMRRRFRDPVLPADASGLSDGKRRLYGSPKIVVAGMSRRLEAAWDGQGRALGVQVYAVESGEDAAWLLGLLNSKLLAYLYRVRNRAKRLAGGYLSVNKSQLGRLPIRMVDADAAPEDHAARTELCGLVRRLGQLANTGGVERGDRADDPPADKERSRLEARVDALVYRLYRLSEQEVAAVEADVSPL